MIYWECRRGLAFETMTAIEARATRPLVGGLETSVDIFAPRGKNSFLGWWMDIVSTYTQASLTRNSDKFIATSALAREMMERVLDQGMVEGKKLEYVAGLWTLFLQYQLLWYVTKPLENTGTRHQRDPSLAAPSWSWAAAPSSIAYERTWRDDTDRLLARVTGFQVTPRSGDPYLGVALNLAAAAFIDVRGWCWRAFLPQPELGPFCIDGFSIYMYWDVLPTSGTTRVDVYFLPVFLRIDEWSGLVLTKRPANGPLPLPLPAMYERVGRFTITTNRVVLEDSPEERAKPPLRKLSGRGPRSGILGPSDYDGQP
jgi:hypothetical protein